MPIGDLLAQITGEPSPTTTTFSPLPKRKAEDDLRRASDKTQRVGLQPANSSRPIVPPRKPSAVDTSKPVQNGERTSISRPATSSYKNGQLTPSSTTGPLKPPKKGSFAEIMARGKAAQTNLGPVGRIQHKKIEKQPSRRAREAMLAQKGKTIQNALAPNSKFQRRGRPSLGNEKNGAKQLNGKAPNEPEKKFKKAALATTGYAGTARPKLGDRAASKPGPRGNSSNDRDRYRRHTLGSRNDRYLSEDEEDEELEDDEEEDYESDESDMEAAAFEVDEEEEAAARIARKEDAEALAEENRLKREKEEKKRKLLAMAKKAKPNRY